MQDRLRLIFWATLACIAVPVGVVAVVLYPPALLAGAVVYIIMRWRD